MPWHSVATHVSAASMLWIQNVSQHAPPAHSRGACQLASRLHYFQTLQRNTVTSLPPPCRLHHLHESPPPPVTPCSLTPIPHPPPPLPPPGQPALTNHQPSTATHQTETDCCTPGHWSHPWGAGSLTCIAAFFLFPSPHRFLLFLPMVALTSEPVAAASPLLSERPCVLAFFSALL